MGANHDGVSTPPSRPVAIPSRTSLLDTDGLSTPASTWIQTPNLEKSLAELSLHLQLNSEAKAQQAELAEPAQTEARDLDWKRVPIKRESSIRDPAELSSRTSTPGFFGIYTPQIAPDRAFRRRSADPLRLHLSPSHPPWRRSHSTSPSLNMPAPKAQQEHRPFIPGGARDFTKGMEHFLLTGVRSISRSRVRRAKEEERDDGDDWGKADQRKVAGDCRVSCEERGPPGLCLTDRYLGLGHELGVARADERGAYRGRHRRAKRYHMQTPSAPFDVYTAGVGDLLLGIKEGALTCLQVMEAYLAQIDEHNETFRAIAHLAPREDVLRQAAACDEERRRGTGDWEKRALHGIPVLVKDNIGTVKESGMPTTAGSFALLGMPVMKDAYVVRRLKEAGAIIIGKANMSELGSYKSVHAGDGWSPVGGQTVNAYASHASPGTSSSGNGVALAAGFCPLSIGTETDGSITLPCLQSSLYGLKPTHGLLSRAGIVPFAPSFDSAGPMAKDVWSLAVGLDVMQGEDDDDDATFMVPRLAEGYTDSCISPSFEGLRIGIPRKNWHDIDLWRRPSRDTLDSSLSHAFEQALVTMQHLGAHVQDPAEIPSAVDDSLWEGVVGPRSLVVAADCREYLGRYLKALGGEAGCRSVEDIVQFNEDNAFIEMPPSHPDQEILKRCLAAHSIHAAEYVEAKKEMLRVAGKRGLDAVLDMYGLDAIVCVREGGHSLANMVGAPIATVPLGFMADNTPVGAYFIARRGGEQVLFRIMAAWERAFGARRLPPIAYQ